MTEQLLNGSLVNTSYPKSSINDVKVWVPKLLRCIPALKPHVNLHLHELDNL